MYSLFKFHIAPSHNGVSYDLVYKRDRIGYRTLDEDLSDLQVTHPNHNECRYGVASMELSDVVPNVLRPKVAG